MPAMPVFGGAPRGGGSEKESFGSKLRKHAPAAIAGLGLGAGAFAKGGLSDFGVGLASGFAGEKYRQFREGREQENAAYLAEVEGLRNRILEMEKSNYYDSDEIRQAADAFHQAMEDGKLSPKEKADISSLIDRGMATRPHEAQAARQEKEKFTRTKEMELEAYDKAYSAMKKRGEIVPFQAVGQTFWIPSQAAAAFEQQEKLQGQGQEFQEKQLERQGQIAYKAAVLQHQVQTELARMGTAAQLAIAEGQHQFTRALFAAQGMPVPESAAGRFTEIYGQMPEVRVPRAEPGKAPGAAGTSPVPSTTAPAKTLQDYVNEAGGNLDQALALIGRSGVPPMQAAELRRGVNAMRGTAQPGARALPSSPSAAPTAPPTAVPTPRPSAAPTALPPTPGPRAAPPSPSPFPEKRRAPVSQGELEREYPYGPERREPSIGPLVSAAGTGLARAATRIPPPSLGANVELPLSERREPSLAELGDPVKQRLLQLLEEFRLRSAIVQRQGGDVRLRTPSYPSDLALPSQPPY